jgi:hypothetical protein
MTSLLPTVNLPTSYYSDNDDENNIMEKVERQKEEEMQARVLREWHRIESI